MNRKDTKVAELEAKVARLEAELEQAWYEARHDGLTGLLNRGGMNLAAAAEAKNPTMSPAVLVMVDVDSFKAVNDQCGHLTGDLVLKDLARELRNRLGSNAILARLEKGADEFVAICPAERVGLLADLVIPTEHGVEVTISAGVTDWRRYADLSQLLAEADATMYRAKEAKNGIAFYERQRDDHPVPVSGERPEVRVRDLRPSCAKAQVSA